MTAERELGEAALNEEARRWVARLASGEMGGEELASFKQWRSADPAHGRAFESQRALWRVLEPRDAASAAPPLRRSRRRLGWRSGGMRRAIPAAIAAGAAACALAFLAPEAVLRFEADHRSTVAVESVRLADGSAAVLDADSAISIDYSGSERAVTVLRGQVWFDVMHGDRRPFRIRALGGVTQDIGTAFTVSRSADAVEVGVTQGRVAVRAGEQGASLLVTAAQRVRYGSGGPVVRLADRPAADMAVWRSGELLLDRATVRDAAAQIARYRGKPVLVLGDTSRVPRISAAFRTDRPEEAIDALAQSAGLDVYRLPGVTVLRAIAK